MHGLDSAGRGRGNQSDFLLAIWSSCSLTVPIARGGVAVAPTAMYRQDRGDERDHLLELAYSMYLVQHEAGRLIDATHVEHSQSYGGLALERDEPQSLMWSARVGSGAIRNSMAGEDRRSEQLARWNAYSPASPTVESAAR